MNGSYKEGSIYLSIYFLTANWLYQGQLWAILQGIASQTQCKLLWFLLVQPGGHQQSRNEVRSLSMAKHLMEFEPGTFRFQFQCLNPLGYPPQSLNCQKMYFWKESNCTNVLSWTLIRTLSTRFLVISGFNK